MNISVIMHYDEAFASVGDITSKVNREYCQRHGYHFDLRKHYRPEWAPVWSKIERLKKAMDFYEDCDWFLWIDADAMVMNPEIKIESLLIDSADLIVTNDVNGLNSGVFLIRNSTWSRCFLESTWSLRPFFGREAESEQNAMKFLINGPKEISDKVLFALQYRMNSYLYPKYNLPADLEGNYKPGDFILHLPGMKNEDRVQIFKEMM